MKTTTKITPNFSIKYNSNNKYSKTLTTSKQATSKQATINTAVRRKSNPKYKNNNTKRKTPINYIKSKHIKNEPDLKLQDGQSSTDTYYYLIVMTTKPKNKSQSYDPDIAWIARIKKTSNEQKKRNIMEYNLPNDYGNEYNVDINIYSLNEAQYEFIKIIVNKGELKKITKLSDLNIQLQKGVISQISQNYNFNIKIDNSIF